MSIQEVNKSKTGIWLQPGRSRLLDILIYGQQLSDVVLHR